MALQGNAGHSCTLTVTCRVQGTSQQFNQFVLPLQNKDDDDIDIDSDRARAKAENAVDTVKEKLSHAKHQVVQVVPKQVKDAGNAAGDKLGHAKVRQAHDQTLQRRCSCLQLS